MSQVYRIPNGIINIKWLVPLIVVSIIATGFWVWQEILRPSSNQSSLPPLVLKNSSDKIISKDDIPAMKKERNLISKEEVANEPKTPEFDMAVVKAQQAEAAKAAIDAIPVDLITSQRPEFVSKIEWKVLQAAAAQDKDANMRLTHFVNKLLFYKKLAAWEEMLESSNALARRHQLARELLDMLPGQLKEEAIDLKTSQKMESRFLADLNNSDG